MVYQIRMIINCLGQIQRAVLHSGANWKDTRVTIHSIHPVELTPTQNHYPQMKCYLEVSGGITIII